METSTKLTPLEGRTWPVVINDTTNDGKWNLISIRVMFFCANALGDIRTFHLNYTSSVTNTTGMDFP